MDKPEVMELGLDLNLSISYMLYEALYRNVLPTNLIEVDYELYLDIDKATWQSLREEVVNVALSVNL